MAYIFYARKMVLPLPKWIMQRYSILWAKFKHNEFTYDEAANALNKDSMLSIVLSGLRKTEWMEIKLDMNDARRRLYLLKSPEDAVIGIASKKIVDNAGKKKKRR